MNVLKYLGIDTSGKIASVAVCSEDSVLAQTTVLTNLTHSQVILPLCKKLLLDIGMRLDEIDVIAVAEGPGSYTGLRIGISAAKAMSFALNKPCVGVSTLESLAYNIPFDTICSIINARQDLVYCAIFTKSDGVIKRVIEDGIMSKDDLISCLNGLAEKIFLVGDGAVEFHEMYNRRNMVVAPPHLRLQLASSLCFAAMNKKLSTAENLNAKYLQITKAEKDLKDNL